MNSAADMGGMLIVPDVTFHASSQITNIEDTGH